MLAPTEASLESSCILIEPEIPLVVVSDDEDDAVGDHVHQNGSNNHNRSNTGHMSSAMLQSNRSMRSSEVASRGALAGPSIHTLPASNVSKNATIDESVILIEPNIPIITIEDDDDGQNGVLQKSMTTGNNDTFCKLNWSTIHPGSAAPWHRPTPAFRSIENLMQRTSISGFQKANNGHASRNMANLFYSSHTNYTPRQ